MNFGIIAKEMAIRVGDENERIAELRMCLLIYFPAQDPLFFTI
jgi:hypothetical protein